MKLEDRFLKISGWCTRDGISLIQRVEAWNGGKKSTIFCSEESLINIFNSHDKFGIHNIIVDEDFVNIRKNMFCIMENILVISSDKNSDMVEGIVLL